MRRPVVREALVAPVARVKPEAQGSGDLPWVANPAFRRAEVRKKGLGLGFTQCLGDFKN